MAEAYARRDTPGSDHDNPPSPQPTHIPSSMARKGLVETIESCFSRDSPLRKPGQPYLSSPNVYLRTQAQLIEEGNATPAKTLSSTSLSAELKEINTSQAVILVRNIDDEWCEALCSRFPQRMNERFVSEHAMGLTLPAHCTCQYETSPSCEAVEADVDRVVQLLSGRLDPPFVGFHINYWRESKPATSHSRPDDHCFLQRASQSTRPYGSISCCQVEAHLCE